MEKNALAVMVRVPVPGAVKTRLTPELSPLEACLLYEAFLKDLFSRLSALTSTDIFIFYTGHETAPDGREIVPDGHEIAPDNSGTAADKIRQLSNVVPEFFTLTPQKDGDLGSKMQDVFKELFGRGYTCVALIGSDSPDLPLAYLRRAFTLLTGPCTAEPRPLVLGPALDGGYYLIAMNDSLASFSARLFDGIEWGACSVLQQTLGRAADAGMRVAMLAQWHDIDTCDDLAFISAGAELPATVRVLQGLDRRS